MLDAATIDQLAAELDASARKREPLTHFSKRFPGMTIDDGYRVGRAWVALQRGRGDPVIGHKIGLTSRAMQLSSQIDEPDFGTLLGSMKLVAKAGEELEIPVNRFLSPRVEVELAFVLKQPLGGKVTVDEVLAATDHVTPAIEIIDARIEQFDRHTKAPRKVFDTISDNAANAAIVIGEGDDRYRADPRTTDLPWCGAILKLNGAVEETGLAAGVQGHPAIGIAWLAEKLQPWGETLQPGQIVLAGSFTRPVPARAGDRFEADYGPLGVLRFRFV
jgi:2-oxo-hept-3-ene-1,7-dioate hydratase